MRSFPVILTNSAIISKRVRFAERYLKPYSFLAFYWPMKFLIILASNFPAEDPDFRNFAASYILRFFNAL